MKKISQASQRRVQVGNSPTAFAPNPGIAFDQQNAQTAALDAVSNYQPSQGKIKPTTHYKKANHFPTAKPIAK